MIRSHKAKEVEVGDVVSTYQYNVFGPIGKYAGQVAKVIKVDRIFYTLEFENGETIETVRFNFMRHASNDS